MIIHVNTGGRYKCHQRLKIGIFKNKGSNKLLYKTMRTRDLLKLIETKDRAYSVFDYEDVTGDYLALRVFLPQAVLVEVFYDEMEVDVFCEETDNPETIKCTKELMDKLKDIRLG